MTRLTCHRRYRLPAKTAAAKSHYPLACACWQLSFNAIFLCQRRSYRRAALAETTAAVAATKNVKTVGGAVAVTVIARRRQVALTQTQPLLQSLKSELRTAVHLLAKDLAEHSTQLVSTIVRERTRTRFLLVCVVRSSFALHFVWISANLCTVRCIEAPIRREGGGLFCFYPRRKHASLLGKTG